MDSQGGKGEHRRKSKAMANTNKDVPNVQRLPTQDEAGDTGGHTDTISHVRGRTAAISIL